jgi:hypothetical protein
MAKGFKTGGRQKGTSNKITQDVRVLLKELVSKEITEIDKLLKDVEPKDRLEFIIKLLPYTLPKFEGISYDSNQEDKPPSPFMELIRNQAANGGKVIV